MERGTILITGGSRGIGAATARLAAAAGHDVCFTYATQHEAAEALVTELERGGVRAAALQADMADFDAAGLLGRVPAGLAPLAGLVNNAGITGPIGPFDRTSLDTMRCVLEVNVTAVMRLTQAYLRHCRAARRPAVVVNVSSIAATLGAPGEYVHYAASKAAVEAFTVGLAKEVASEGFRINAVSPGTAQTDIHATAGEPGRPQRVAARIPLGRVAQPTEIAEAILYLLSSRASYVTGAVLRVGGGL